MKRSLLFCLLPVALLSLAACTTNQQKLERLKALSPEDHTVNLFANMCVSTGADEAKIEEKLKAMERSGLAVAATPEKLASIHFKTDEPLNAWGILNPVNGQRYSLTVTKRKSCIITAKQLNADAARAKFRAFVDKLAAGMKSQATQKKGPAFESENAQVDAYFIPLPNLAIGPMLSLMVPNQPDHAYALILNRVVAPEPGK